MAWSALTHQTYSQWKDEDLSGKRLFVLFSGGGDSVALLSLLSELQGPLKFELSAGHIHHGPGDLEAARDRALEFCREFCRKRKIPFHWTRSEEALKSEADLRNFRRTQALRWCEHLQQDRLVVAHHAEDLFETRFFRLLRGTGGRGLRAMRPWGKPWWRPLLQISRTELRAHLSWHKLPFLEDPSNRDLSFTRNWLRHELFPQLEKKRAGSLRKMARSLENLAQVLDTEIELKTNTLTKGLSRPWFLTLSSAHQKRALAQYLWGLGQRHFRHTQLEEIRKQLDKSQLEHRFSLAGCDWVLNAEQIQAFPKGKGPLQIEA